MPATRTLPEPALATTRRRLARLMAIGAVRAALRAPAANDEPDAAVVAPDSTSGGTSPR